MNEKDIPKKGKVPREGYEPGQVVLSDEARENVKKHFKGGISKLDQKTGKVYTTNG